jgi:hypothetical protein
MLQDRFEFNNFCHVIFDGITRLSHYLTTFGYDGERFVCGGIPGRYHELLATGISELFNIPQSSLIFPSRPIFLCTRGKVVWFSDQRELHAHPAQMAHPSSISLLAKICSRVPGDISDVRRLYISRGDAQHRRVTNEPDLMSCLEPLGFKSVQLAKLPVDDQLALFRGAEIVVGPHGQGLTNIIVGKHIGRVIELFHPSAGTDAYAQIARSSGMNYDYVIGATSTYTAADFSVKVEQVRELLTPEHIRVRKPNLHKAANLIPASRTFRGFFRLPRVDDPKWPVIESRRMFADQETCVHQKFGSPQNTNVGQWLKASVIPNATYTASCWVWIAPGFTGTAVEMRIGNAEMQARQVADLARTGCWQRISVTSVVRPRARDASVSLHISGDEGIGVLSTAWQLERGATATAYVSTG